MPAATKPPAEVSPEQLRRSELLEDLTNFAAEAALAVVDRIKSPARCMEFVFAFNRLMTLAARLLGFAVRVGAGRAFPKPRPRLAPELPRERNSLLAARRIPFHDLIALRIPGAEAFQDRLALMLADPEMAELLASEPAAWRAVAPLARLFRLPKPPRREIEQPEPEPAREPDAPRPARAGAPPAPEEEPEEDEAPHAGRPWPHPWPRETGPPPGCR